MTVFILLNLLDIHFHGVHKLWLLVYQLPMLLLLKMMTMVIVMMMSIELIPINYGNGKLIEISHHCQLAATIFQFQFVVVAVVVLLHRLAVQLNQIQYTGVWISNEAEVLGERCETRAETNQQQPVYAEITHISTVSLTHSFNHTIQVSLLLLHQFITSVCAHVSHHEVDLSGIASYINRCTRCHHCHHRHCCYVPPPRPMPSLQCTMHETHQIVCTFKHTSNSVLPFTKSTIEQTETYSIAKCIHTEIESENAPPLAFQNLHTHACIKYTNKNRMHSHNVKL